MYAVIQQGSRQYKISPVEVIDIDRIPYKEKETFEVDKVLLLADKDTTKIGQPHIPKTKVKFKILKHLKGEKVRVARFKAKSRYSKVKGFRSSLTRVRVELIESDGKKYTSL